MADVILTAFTCRRGVKIDKQQELDEGAERNDIGSWELVSIGAEFGLDRPISQGMQRAWDTQMMLGDITLSLVPVWCITSHHLRFCPEITELCMLTFVDPMGMPTGSEKSCTRFNKRRCGWRDFY